MLSILTWCRACGVWGLPCGVLLVAHFLWAGHRTGPLRTFPATGPIVAVPAFPLSVSHIKGQWFWTKPAALRLKTPGVWGLLNPE